jgi:hypothetical protein
MAPQVVHTARLGDEVAERRRRKDHKKEAMDMISI